MEKFLEKWDALSAKTRKILEIVAGAILAVISGIFLFISGGDNSSYVTIILAIGVPMLVPNILERKSGRRFGTLRIAMLVTLFAVLGIMVVEGLITGKFTSK